MTGDHRFEDVYSTRAEGGPMNMCEVLDRIESKGRAEGRAEMAESMAKNLKAYLTDAQIAEIIAKSQEQNKLSEQHF